MKRAEILQQFCDSYFRLGQAGAKLQEATQEHKDAQQHFESAKKQFFAMLESDDVKSCGNFGWEARMVHFWPQVIRDLLAMQTTSPALSASCGSAAEQLGAGEVGKE